MSSAKWSHYCFAQIVPANVSTVRTMSGLPKASPPLTICPFCGVATDVNHENQEGCIAALHEEIGRMRVILASLRPAGVPELAPDEDREPAAIRLSLD